MDDYKTLLARVRAQPSGQLAKRLRCFSDASPCSFLARPSYSPRSYVISAFALLFYLVSSIFYLVSWASEYLNHGRQQHKAATGAKLLIDVGVHICQLCLAQLGSALADVSCGGGGNWNLVFPFVQSDFTSSWVAKPTPCQPKQPLWGNKHV